MLTSQKKSTRAIASNDKMPDMMVLLYQKQCLKNFQGIQELFNNPGLANYSTVYIKQYVENDWMTVYGTKTSKYTKWILVTRYLLRTGPTTKWIQSTKYGLQDSALTVHISGLLAQGTFSATVGVVAFVRVYPDAHFELLSILIFDHE